MAALWAMAFFELRAHGRSPAQGALLVGVAAMQAGAAFALWRSPAAALFAFTIYMTSAATMRLLAQPDARAVLLFGGTLSFAQVAGPMGGPLSASTFGILAAALSRGGDAHKRSGLLLLLFFMPAAVAVALAGLDYGPAIFRTLSLLVPAPPLPLDILRAPPGERLIYDIALLPPAVPMLLVAVARLGPREGLRVLVPFAAFWGGALLSALFGSIHHPGALLAGLSAVVLAAATSWPATAISTRDATVAVGLCALLSWPLLVAMALAG